jgi:hypothetical protein
MFDWSTGGAVCARRSAGDLLVGCVFQMSCNVDLGGAGWQVAADANSTGDMYPDQSLYACNSGPDLARRINKSLLRSDVIEVLFSDYVLINQPFSRSKKRAYATIGWCRLSPTARPASAAHLIVSN